MIHMAWPYPLAMNITNLMELFSYGNSVTDGLFGNTLPFSIFAISLGMMYGRVEIKDSMMVAGYITTLFSVFLKVVGMVSDPVVVLFVLIAAVSTIAAVFQK